MADYTEIFASEPETDEEFQEMLGNAEAYIDANIAKVDAEDADYMLYLYTNTARMIVEEEDEKLEGLLERYGNRLTDMMRTFMELELEEIQDPVSAMPSEKGSDGSSGEEMFFREAMERALKVEALVRENRETISSKTYEYLKPTVTWQYEYYINYMLLGTADAPVFGTEDHLFKETAKAIYTELAQAEPDTTTAWAVNEYFNYLESVDFRLDYKQDADAAKVYYDTCSYIVDKAGKLLYE